MPWTDCSCGLALTLKTLMTWSPSGIASAPRLLEEGAGSARPTRANGVGFPNATRGVVVTATDALAIAEVFRISSAVLGSQYGWPPADGTRYFAPVLGNG